MKHFNLMQKQHPYEVMSRSFNEQWLHKLKDKKKTSFKKPPFSKNDTPRQQVNPCHSPFTRAL